jgi:hypothetical protein
MESMNIANGWSSNSMEWYNILVIAAFVIGFMALISGEDNEPH